MWLWRGLRTDIIYGYGTPWYSLLGWLVRLFQGGLLWQIWDFWVFFLCECWWMKNLLIFLVVLYLPIMSFCCIIVFEPVGMLFGGGSMKIYFSYLSLSWRIFLGLRVTWNLWGGICYLCSVSGVSILSLLTTDPLLLGWSYFRHLDLSLAFSVVGRELIITSSWVFPIFPIYQALSSRYVDLSVI